ncbi:MAG: hypothetical protein R3B72_09105 [Polyangiaceae bacterium]
MQNRTMMVAAWVAATWLSGCGCDFAAECEELNGSTPGSKGLCGHSATVTFNGSAIWVDEDDELQACQCRVDDGTLVDCTVDDS